MTLEYGPTPEPIALNYAAHGPIRQTPRGEVRMGMPKLWRLDEMLYGMKKLRSTLEPLGPSAVTFDPNATNASSLSIVSSGLGIGISRDQAQGINDAAGLQRRRLDLARFESLTTRRDETVAEIADLRKQLAAIPKGEEHAKERELLDARLSASKQNLSDLDTALGGLSSLPAGPTGTSAPAVESMTVHPLPSTDDLKKALGLVENVNEQQLTASARLDNYTRFLYELTARRLSTREDNLAATAHPVIVELNVGISPTAASKGDLLRTAWRSSAWRFVADTEKQNTALQALRTQILGATEAVKQSEPEIQYAMRALGRHRPAAEQQGMRAAATPLLDISDKIAQTTKPAPEAKEAETRSVIDDLADRVAEPRFEDWQALAKGRPSATSNDKVRSPRGHWERLPVSPRCDRLIPDRTQLNIHAKNAKISRINVLGLLKTVIGFGLSTGYSRQKEEYRSFIDQAVFAAGFGSGQDTFGWDHSPVPGTQLIKGGEHSTFALLLVPDGAHALLLEPAVEWYGRRRLPPLTSEASPQVGYLLPLSTGREPVFDSVAYSPGNAAGTSTLVTLRGRYLPHDLDIFIDGIPLKECDRMSKCDSQGTTTAGYFERVSDEELRLLLTSHSNLRSRPAMWLETPTGTTRLHDALIPAVNGTAEAVPRTLAAILFGDEARLFREQPRMHRIKFLLSSSDTQDFVVEGDNLSEGLTYEYKRRDGAWTAIPMFASPSSSWARPRLAPRVSELHERRLMLRVIRRKGRDSQELELLDEVRAELPVRPILSKVTPTVLPKGGGLLLLSGENLDVVRRVRVGATPIAVERAAEDAIQVNVTACPSGTRLLVSVETDLTIDGSPVLGDGTREIECGT